MKITELLNERVLITAKERFGTNTVCEVKVLEISPSENWVKLMNIHGLKYWKPIADISLVEVLKKIEKCPKEA